MAEFKPFEMIMRIEYGGAVNDGDYMQVCCKAKPVSELVRCKDCKYFGEYCDEYKEETQNDGMCDLDIKDSVTFDFFCADGERRDPCSSQDS